VGARSVLWFEGGGGGVRYREGGVVVDGPVIWGHSMIVVWWALIVHCQQWWRWRWWARWALVACYHSHVIGAAGWLLVADGGWSSLVVDEMRHAWMNRWRATSAVWWWCCVLGTTGCCSSLLALL
jgi:hypothetical protein